MLRDAFGFKSVDAGGGWLIFALPPSELGAHPAEGPTYESGVRHQITFMCDDIRATIAELRMKGVQIDREPQDEGYGVTAMMTLPGGANVMLYEPRHAKHRRSGEAAGGGSTAKRQAAGEPVGGRSEDERPRPGQRVRTALEIIRVWEPFAGVVGLQTRPDFGPIRFVPNNADDAVRLAGRISGDVYIKVTSAFDRLRLAEVQFGLTPSSHLGPHSSPYQRLIDDLKKNFASARQELEEVESMLKEAPKE